MGPGRRRWGEFAVGGVLAVSYFIAIIITTDRNTFVLKRAFEQFGT